MENFVDKLVGRRGLVGLFAKHNSSTSYGAKGPGFATRWRQNIIVKKENWFQLIYHLNSASFNFNLWTSTNTKGSIALLVLP